MDRFFCFGKKDFCELDTCAKCEYEDGDGGLTESQMKSVISKLLGEEYDIDRLRNMVEDSKWISVKDHLPPERDSIFKKLIGLEKWREGIEGLCQRESDYVIVSVRFSDGTEKTGRARTEDGHWVELPTIGCPVVTHWRPFPKPCNGGK